MKSLLFFTIFFSFCTLPVTSHAQNIRRTETFGVGVMVGDTTSVLGKYWANPRGSVDLAVGSGYNREGWVQVSYLNHFLQAFGTGSRFSAELTPYVGAGVGLGFNRFIYDARRDTDFFVRMPVGLAWLPMSTPIDVFLEVAPTASLSPASGIYLSGNLGGHFYF